VARFQQTSRTIKHAQVPVVAAVQAWRSAAVARSSCTPAAPWRRWSYIGLVEAGVGLIPAGGGCKEFAVRAAALRRAASAATSSRSSCSRCSRPSPWPTCRRARWRRARLGFLRKPIDVVFNAHEFLHVARPTPRPGRIGWRPALPPRGIKVAGRNGIATLEMMLVNMREGGMISAHDYRVARAPLPRCAAASRDRHALVSEEWLLDVERANSSSC
jgi:3-hydroxyacyl-CoA dehydrogenase